jgi:PIN domain nuclease of toxin-antitoxin system
MGRSNLILIDTHVWIWLNLDPVKLSASARELLVSEKQIAISTLSIYETMNAAAKGRIDTPYEPELLVRRWLRSSDTLRIPVSEEIILLSRTLNFLHSDPFDRMIASTAVVEKVPVMTADKNLLELDWLQTVPAR